MEDRGLWTSVGFFCLAKWLAVGFIKEETLDFDRLDLLRGFVLPFDSSPEKMINPYSVTITKQNDNLWKSEREFQ